MGYGKKLLERGKRKLSQVQEIFCVFSGIDIQGYTFVNTQYSVQVMYCTIRVPETCIILLTNKFNEKEITH